MPTAMLKPCRDSRCVSALFRRPTGLADGLALKELALPPTRGEDSPQPLVPPLPPVRPGGLGRLAIGREYTPRPDVFMRVSSRPGTPADRAATALPGGRSGGACVKIRRRGTTRALKPEARPLTSCAPQPDHEDLRSHSSNPRAQLARRRRDGQDARPPRDGDRQRAPRQAQAGVHAALRRRRLRDRGQRREGHGDRQQAPGEALLPPQRLPGWAALADVRGDDRAPPRGSAEAGGQGDAAAQPARSPAAPKAEDLRGAGPSASGPAACPSGGLTMADEPTNGDDETTPDATTGSTGSPGNEGQDAEQQPTPDAPAPEESAPAAEESAPAAEEPAPA